MSLKSGIANNINIWVLRIILWLDALLSRSTEARGNLFPVRSYGFYASISPILKGLTVYF